MTARGGPGAPAEPAAGVVLSVNSGSSSLKIASFAGGAGDERIADASVERIGDARSRVRLRPPGTPPAETTAACPDHRAALDLVLARLAQARVDPPAAVGHRIVHGGPRHVDPERVSPALLGSLRELVPLAPLHMPPGIAGIEAVSAALPGVSQVACFDTAFHAGLPEAARRLPIPDRFPEVRRYGFHGLSYEYVTSTLGDAPPPRLIIAHLGNGASLVAIQEGRPIDTTMGLTPTGGVPMGTRTGDLDPGVLFYLARTRGLSLDALEEMVDRESGLLGLAGTSDMKALLERRRDDPRAALAVDVFAYAVRKAIGAFAAALGGLDLLIFTGGIGEHAAEIRAGACRGLEPFGVVLDADRNARAHDPISADGSRCLVRVVPTDEDRVIARHVRRLLSPTARG